MRTRWGLLEATDASQMVREAQERLDRTQEDNAKVDGLLKATRKKQYDYVAQQIERSFRGSHG